MSEPQTVVVTGASAGVGRAVARAFGERGARVGLIARGRDGLEGARREVEEAGGRALILQADVSDFEQVEAAAGRAEEAFGPTDVWVNAAMTTVFAPFEQNTAEEYRRVTEVTYLGCVHGTMAALSRMKPRDHGTIVQIGSALAYRGIPLQAAYCGSKHAIKGFTESLRAELLHDRSKVHLTMVQLPGLNTPQFDVGRNKMPYKGQPVPPIYQPEFAAEAVLLAVDGRRREVYAGLPTVQVIVGNKIAPGIVDRYLALTGYEGQQTNEPEDPNRPDYLWGPVPGDRGAHGRFDEQSRRRDPQFWVTNNRRWLALAGAGLAGLVSYALIKEKA